MANPRLSLEINKRRWYRNPNRHEGEPFYPPGGLWWSVTVVTRALPAEGLKYWAANEVASYAVSYMQEWSDLPAAQAMKKLAAAPWAIRDAAGVKGTELHSIMERRLGGEDFSLEASADPTVAAAMQFVEDCRPTPLALESTIFNDRHGYAGTFDFSGWLGAYPQLGRCMLDWKQSKSVHRDMGAQLEAYAHAEYWVDDDDKEHELQPPDNLVVVHFRPDGYSLHVVPKGPGYFRAFLAALELRKWERFTPDLGDAPQAALEPAQERFEAASLQAQVNWLRGRIKDLGPDVALQLSARCADLGIPTRPSLLDAQGADALLGLVRLAEAGKL